MKNSMDSKNKVVDQAQYQYDPECECWYRVYTRDDYDALPHWEKYSWIYVTVVLAVICYIATV